ncbi:hypothetical protein SAMN04487783_2431 [Agrococcus baldri]|uniref:Uncharacterized protein n=2 Tax=Agrococcus baldri TaxID=153730 RepID=A0AA94L0G5_9MICO|nr:hypothetical protein SAMN04487783_2431 [Agrococcus baldri]
MVTVAAALLTVTAMVGCGLMPTAPEAVSVTPPPSVTEPPAVVAPPAETARPPLSPATEVPLAPVPTVHGPYVPPVPQPDPSATPSPAATPSPSAGPSPGPNPGPTPAPSPDPARLLALLPMAHELPQLRWASARGERTAAWSEMASAAATTPEIAIVHVGAAREAGGACAAAAEAVDGAAIEAAAASFAAEPAPGAPFDLVLVRYPSPTAAAQALAALQRLGIDCAGVETDTGEFGAGQSAHGPTALLRAADAVLIAEATVIDALLVTVLHEGAPPEAVATLLAAPR